MKGFDLVLNTLALLKVLHDDPECGARIDDPRSPCPLKERVELAPKTLNQLDAAIAECAALKLQAENSQMKQLLIAAQAMSMTIVDFQSAGYTLPNSANSYLERFNKAVEMFKPFHDDERQRQIVLDMFK